METTDWAWESASHFAGEHKFFVFPLMPGAVGVYPGFNWAEESSNSRVRLAQWKTMYPGSNYACDLRKSGLFVVRVDVEDQQHDGSWLFTREGYDELLNILAAEDCWDFDGEMTVGTGSGGWEWWVRRPVQGDPQGTVLGRRVRVGYNAAVLPGSRVQPSVQHPLADGFNRPEAAATLDPVPAPSWLVRRLLDNS